MADISNNEKQDDEREELKDMSESCYKFSLCTKGNIKKSLYYIISISFNGPFHDYVSEIVSSKWYNYLILIVVVLHNILVALKTSYTVTVKAAWYLKLFEGNFLSFYIMEYGMKIYAWRVDFFKQPPNIFDLVLFLNFLLSFSGTFDYSIIMSHISTVIGVCLALRILRLLILLNYLKKLKVIFGAVLKSLPALGSIVILITLFLYIFTIIGHGVYSQVDSVRYGNLGRTSFTLFQLLTLDDWFNMYTDVINYNSGYQHIIVYLVMFIVLETFIFVKVELCRIVFESKWPPHWFYGKENAYYFSLFVAVIVDNLARAQDSTRRLHNVTTNKDETLLSKENSNDSQAHKDMVPLTEDLLSHQMISQTIDHYYPQLSAKDKLLHKRYWQLLACLEHNVSATQKHQCILDELVYLVDFTKN